MELPGFYRSPSSCLIRLVPHPPTDSPYQGIGLS
jgi:hypothetical protein